MTTEEIVIPIKVFCLTHYSRKRSDLYNFLSFELKLDLEVDPFQRNVHFGSDHESQVYEANYILENVLSEPSSSILTRH